VQVNLMPAATPSLRLGNLGVTAAPSSSRSTMFPINVMFSDGVSGLAAEIEYATAVFDRATIQKLGDRLKTILQAVGEQPDASVRSLCRMLDGAPGLSAPAAILSPAPGAKEDA
jgi:non-ribosomal peptide synthetase component F